MEEIVYSEAQATWRIALVLAYRGHGTGTLVNKTSQPITRIYIDLSH
jgi:hypothetical protein